MSRTKSDNALMMAVLKGRTFIVLIVLLIFLELQLQIF